MEKTNKVVLLCEYKMMKMDWSAWTFESYASMLQTLTDTDIEGFYLLTDSEIETIQKEVNTYRQQYVTH